MRNNYYISQSPCINQFMTIATSHINNYMIKLFIRERVQSLADVAIFLNKSNTR